jgi:hypothetical protein
MGMTGIFVIGAVIIVLVIGITALVTTKAYEYKHTIDPIEHNPHLDREEIHQFTTTEINDNKESPY